MFDFAELDFEKFFSELEIFKNKNANVDGLQNECSNFIENIKAFIGVRKCPIPFHFETELLKDIIGLNTIEKKFLGAPVSLEEVQELQVKNRHLFENILRQFQTKKYLSYFSAKNPSKSNPVLVEIIDILLYPPVVQNRFWEMKRPEVLEWVSAQEAPHDLELLIRHREDVQVQPLPEIAALKEKWKFFRLKYAQKLMSPAFVSWLRSTTTLLEGPGNLWTVRQLWRWWNGRVFQAETPAEYHFSLQLACSVAQAIVRSLEHTHLLFLAQMILLPYKTVQDLEKLVHHKSLLVCTDSPTPGLATSLGGAELRRVREYMVLQLSKHNISPEFQTKSWLLLEHVCRRTVRLQEFAPVLKQLQQGMVVPLEVLEMILLPFYDTLECSLQKRSALITLSHLRKSI